MGEESEWTQDEDGAGMWSKPVGDGTIDLEIYDDEMADWPPLVALNADLASLRAENERLHGLLRDADVHLGTLCDERYETRYEGVGEPCPGCFDTRDAIRAAIAAARPSEGSREA